MENKVLKRSSKPRIAYPPRPPVEPFKSTPIIDIPDTPDRPQFYSADFEEEKNKLYSLHVEPNNQYEEKLRQGIMYMVDRVEWSSFYDFLVGIVAARDELKRKEVAFKPLVQKWMERNSDITLMCISINHNETEISFIQ